ncbi:hypothetical protein Droror1_Dr00008483 [Drosera rotundifolia]
MSFCEKFWSAIASSPVLRTTAGAPQQSLLDVGAATRVVEDEDVPIAAPDELSLSSDNIKKSRTVTKTDDSSIVSSREADTNKSSTAPSKIEQGGIKTDHAVMEDRFGAYIERAGSRIRAAPTARGGKVSLRRDSFNNKVSNYINNAKRRLQTMPSLNDNDAIPQGLPSTGGLKQR